MLSYIISYDRTLCLDTVYPQILNLRQVHTQITPCPQLLEYLQTEAEYCELLSSKAEDGSPWTSCSLVSYSSLSGSKHTDWGFCFHTTYPLLRLWPV